MSNSGKCKDNLNFCPHYELAEKNQPKVQDLLRKIKKELRLSALASQYWLLSQQSSLLQGKQKFPQPQPQHTENLGPVISLKKCSHCQPLISFLQKKGQEKKGTQSLWSIRNRSAVPTKAQKTTSFLPMVFDTKRPPSIKIIQRALHITLPSINRTAQTMFSI